MAETIRKIDYFYATTPNKPREGARILNALKDRGVNLLAFHAFPEDEHSQLDFVPENSAAFKKAAQEAGIKLAGPKPVFLIEGVDRAGAAADLLSRLGEAKINVTAMDAVVAGDRYGALLWVSPKDVEKAAEVLDAE